MSIYIKDFLAASRKIRRLIWRALPADHRRIVWVNGVKKAEIKVDYFIEERFHDMNISLENQFTQKEIEEMEKELNASNTETG